MLRLQDVEGEKVHEGFLKKSPYGKTYDASNVVHFAQTNRKRKEKTYSFVSFCTMELSVSISNIRKVATLPSSRAFLKDTFRGQTSRKIEMKKSESAKGQVSK